MWDKDPGEMRTWGPRVGGNMGTKRTRGLGDPGDPGDIGGSNQGDTGSGNRGDPGDTGHMGDTRIGDPKNMESENPENMGTKKGPRGYIGTKGTQGQGSRELDDLGDPR